MRDCAMELCPNWSGDGRVCPCAVFGLDRYAAATQDDADGPTAGGEGDGTVGTRETAQTLTGGSALDAAIEAATIAVHDAHCSPDCRESPTTMGMFTSVAEAAVRAAEPILRQAAAEDIARRIEELYDEVRHDASERVTAAECAWTAREVGRP